MTEILKVENLSYAYPKSHQGVRLLNFSIQLGEWVSVVGKNGSGKSTLGQLLMGLLPYDSGAIYFKDILLNELNFELFRGEIGYVFQNPQNQFVGITVEEDLAFGLENRQVPTNQMMAKIEQALRMVDMLEYAKTNIDELSGGQMQRVAIASALVLEPKLLILDEATTMIDPESRLALLQLLNRLKNEYQLTIISITHDANELQFSDRVLVLENGQLKGLEDNNRNTSIEVFGLESNMTYQLAQQLSIDMATIPLKKTKESVANWLWTSFVKK